MNRAGLAGRELAESHVLTGPPAERVPLRVAHCEDMKKTMAERVFSHALLLLRQES